MRRRLPASAESAATVTVAFTLAPLDGAVSEPVGGVVSMIAELLDPLVAVQVRKNAVTRHTKSPSPGSSEQSRAVIGVDAVVSHAPVQVEPAVSRRSTT